MSSLPGKALRTLVDIARYSIYQFTHCFTRETSDYDIILDICVDFLQ